MIIGRLTAKAQNDYKHYEKPPFSPPAKVFPIVWPLLYTSMGVAYQLSYAHAAHKRETVYNTCSLCTIRIELCVDDTLFQFKTEKDIFN